MQKTSMTDITKKPIVRYHFVHINRMRKSSKLWVFLYTLKMRMVFILVETKWSEVK